MSATEMVARPVSDDLPACHLFRRSERRADGTVLTLCGLVRPLKPPEPGAEVCEKCADVRRLVRGLEDL